MLIKETTDMTKSEQVSIHNTNNQYLRQLCVMPMGIIYSFSGSTTPKGYLPCNGERLSKSDYPDLFNVIGYQYGGSGDYFSLPLYDGYIIKATDTDINGGYEYVDALVDGLQNNINALSEKVEKSNTDLKENIEKSVLNERTYAHNTFSNALKGKVSGEAVVIKGISPLEHELKVKVSGRESKNLFRPDDDFIHDFSGLSIEWYEDGRFRLYGSAVGYPSYSIGEIQLSAGDYSFSRRPSDWIHDCYLYLSYSDNYIVVPEEGCTFTLTEDTTVKIGLNIETNDAFDCVFALQLEEGTEVTEYEPPIFDLTSVKVSRFGKNLLNLQGRTDAQPTGNWPISKYDVGNVIYRGFAYSGYYQQPEDYRCDVTVDGNIIAITQKSDNYGIGYVVKCRPNIQYTFSSTTDLNRFYTMFIDKDGNKLDTGSWAKTFTTTAETEYIIICLYNNTAGTFTVENPQLELGSTQTEYEPYKECTEYTPTADGTVNGVTSFYPTTTLTTDTEGVIIDCEYNKDINKLSGIDVDVPRKTSELINDSNFATQDYVEQEIANFDFIKIVTELPEAGLVNRTYFVPKQDPNTNDLYDEYMWVDNKWELITTKQIEVDLTEYVKHTDINQIYSPESENAQSGLAVAEAIEPKADKKAVEELKSDLADITITNINGVTAKNIEYNLYVLANEVLTWESFLSDTGLSIIKGFRTIYSGNTVSYESNFRYNSVKIPVKLGDLIRFKLMPYYFHTSPNGLNFLFIHNSSTDTWTNIRIGFGDNATNYDVLYSDLAENGFMIPNNVDYLIADVYWNYYLLDGTLISKSAAYGDTDHPTFISEIITKNKEPSYTAYDGLKRASHYVPATGGVYYEVEDDLRIKRYETALGDIKAVLAEVVGGDE